MILHNYWVTVTILLPVKQFLYVGLNSGNLYETYIDNGILTTKLKLGKLPSRFNVYEKELELVESCAREHFNPVWN